MMIITISQEAAEVAKKRGKILRQGLPPVEIFWKQQGKRRSATSGICDQSVCLVYCTRTCTYKSKIYSGTPLIRPASGQENVVAKLRK